MARHGFRGLVAAAALAVAAQGAAAQDLVQGIAEVSAAMVTRMGADTASATLARIGPPGTGPTADTLGHVMLMSRAFDAAAWYFALAAVTRADAPTLNNLAVALLQAHAAEPGAWPGSFLTTARDAAARAVALAPGEAAMQLTLGQALAALGEAEAAEAAFRSATALDPAAPLGWIALARARAAAGDAAGAGAALAEANARAPLHPAVLLARHDLAGTPAIEAALRVCAVDYRCDEICPKSIIGGLMNVQCEMENMSAQVACSEGRPFAPSYDCTEDFPEWGILVPGLNAGFTVLGPGFKMHVLFDGAGGIRFEGEAGLDYGPASLGAEFAGGARPDSGAVIVDRVGLQVEIAVPSETFRDLDLAGDAETQVLGVTIIGTESPAEIDAAALDDALAQF